MDDQAHALAHAQGIPHDHGRDHEHGHCHDHNHPHIHSPEETRTVVNRLNRAIGHLESVRNMVQDGRDCAEVLTQLSAVRSALNRTALLILQSHMEHCMVEAVRQGRAIFENIRKTVHFLLSCNTGEILTVLLAFLLGWPEPLLAVQLLWVNLVTDSLPALALGVDPCENGLMDRPPRPGRRLFEKGEGVVMLLEGCLIGALALLAFVLGQGQLGSAAAGRTMAFGVLSFSQLVHTLNMHARVPICRGGLRKSGRLLLAAMVGAFLQTLVMVVPVLGAVFGTVGLPLFAWGEILFLSFMPLIPAELGKLGEGRRRHRRRRARN